MAVPRSTGSLVIRLILVLVLAVMAAHFLADVAAVLSGSPAAPALVADLCGFHAMGAFLPLAALTLLASLAFYSRAPRAVPQHRFPAALIHPPA